MRERRRGFLDGGRYEGYAGRWGDVRRWMSGREKSSEPPGLEDREDYMVDAKGQNLPEGRQLQGGGYEQQGYRQGHYAVPAEDRWERLPVDDLGGIVEDRFERIKPLRSSREIREEVCEALTQHPEVDPTEVEVTCEGGEVWLVGRIQDRYQKRLAEHIAERVRGVADVHNRLRLKA
jgi:hypothetical protein